MRQSILTKQLIPLFSLVVSVANLKEGTGEIRIPLNPPLIKGELMRHTISRME